MNNPDGVATDQKNVVIANLSGSITANSNGASANGLTATLTANGVTAFSGFYEQGTQLDPISFNVTVGAPQTVECDQVPSPKPTTTTTSTQPTTPSNPAPSTAAPTTSNPAPSAPAEKKMCTVPGSTSGSLSWGIKSSFRSYIRGGIAKGSWSLSGTTYSGDRFNWTLGKADLNNGTGTLYYNGNVAFSGHNGTLSMQISNVRIKINSANSATLIADVNSSRVDGVRSSNSNVSFASLTGNISANGTEASASNLSATLTADGAAAFAGFYSAGEVIDPVSFSTKAGASQTVECDENGKPISLPKSGSEYGSFHGESTGPAAATGIFLSVALVAVALGAARRTVRA